jgi:hypothetical protein
MRPLRTSTILSIIVAFGVAGRAAAQEDGAWSERLAERIRAVDNRFPVVDRVVIVPDEATYLDELAKWSPDGRWPVIFEHDRLAPMFIRAFATSQVIRRDSVDARRVPPERARQAIEAIVTRAWGGDSAREHARDAFDRARHTPVGIVFTQADDPARCAAVALAAGRGLPIAWLEDEFGRANALMMPADADLLLAAQFGALAAVGLPYDRLGDAIESIAVCMDVSGRIDPSGGAAVEPRDRDYRAVTDLLGRGAGGARFAFAGWIFGDAAYSTYQAMCSLFLDASAMWGMNTYGQSGATGLHTYDILDAASILLDAGWTTDVRQGAQVKEHDWLRALPGGVSADLLFVNTRGNTNFFDMSEGQCYPGDVPVLNRPAMVHFIHSFSAALPASENTLAGQWLEHGAYCYVGSVHEPGLAGFLPPADVTRRLMSGVPFLIAARHWDGSLWKINTFGDPLATCRQPGRDRIAPGDHGGEDVRARLARALEAWADRRDPDAAAEAIRLQVLLGDDEAAAAVWGESNAVEPTQTASRAALPALFRLRRVSEFRAAWIEAAVRDAFIDDMLWHLMLPWMMQRPDDDVLMELRSAIRATSNHGDGKRLAPLLAAAFGAPYARQVLTQELERTTNPLAQRVLRQALQAIR